MKTRAKPNRFGIYIRVRTPTGPVSGYLTSEGGISPYKREAHRFTRHDAVQHAANVRREAPAVDMVVVPV